jgi:O-antigen/teichoic acid export membrane protein
VSGCKAPLRVTAPELNPKMALSLRRNAAWALIGEVAFAACHWGGFIVLGRLAGPQELGRYALALAVVTPIVLFGGLQMRQLQVADATERYPFQDYLAVRLAGTLCAGAIIVAIALLGYAWEVALPILLVGVARGFESLSDVHYGLAQRRKRFDRIAVSMILRGVLGLLALGTGYYLNRDLAVGLVGMAAVWGLVWWLFDRPTSNRLRDSRPAWQPSTERRLELAWTAVPLGIAMLLVALNPNVPRYFLEGMLGLEALGLFAALAHFVITGRLLVNAVCQAAFPRLADLYAVGDRVAFRHLLLRLMGVSALLGLAGLVVATAFGRELLGLVYGPQFAHAADVFPWIMLVGLVLYAQTPFDYGLTAMHQFKIQPLICGLAVMTNVAVCLILVPLYDLLGATIGWLGAAICQFVLAVGVHQRWLHGPPISTSADPG